MRYIELSSWHRLRLRCVLLMVFLAITLSGCATTLPRSPGKNAATYKTSVDIRYNGAKRTYLVHLPPGYDAGHPLPMVVVLHGAFGNANSLEKISGFSELADQKHFIVLYPNGIGAMGKFQHWNAGHCCGKAAEDNIDDVGFLETVINDACSRLAVNRSRIFMTGFSNGGMLTYRFAAEKGDILAAIAPLGASAGGRPDRNSSEWGIPKPVKALPVIAFHGLADDTVPFKGGAVPGKKSQREYWSVMHSLGVWVKRDGCKEPPAKHDERHKKVHVQTWDNCRDNKDIVLYTLEGWPHVWPTAHYTHKLTRQNPLYNFDAASIVWDFFDSHSR